MTKQIANGLSGTVLIVFIYGVLGYLILPDINILYHILNTLGAFIILYILYKKNIYIKK